MTDPSTTPSKSASSASSAWPPSPVVDGLQNERTAMAWSRTALSLLGTGAVLAKQSRSVTVAVAVLVAVGAVATWILVHSSRQHRDRAGWTVASSSLVDGAEIVGATVAAVALAATGLAVLLT